MKTLYALLFLCFTTAAFSQELPESPSEPTSVETSFGYVGLGLGPFPLPLPAFSGGFRKQVGHHGFDVSLQAQTVIELTELKASGLYLHYFKPNVASQFYAGGGLGAGMLWQHRPKFLASPEFVFGKQYRTESDDTRFFQAQISFPTFTSRTDFTRSGVLWFPLVIITYGIGF